MRFLIAILLVASSMYAADRVVLFEDFTNSGCGPCWSIETQVNSFVNSHLAAGDLSVVRVHVSWPSSSDPIYAANPTEQTARKNFYSVSSVPRLYIDGTYSGGSSSVGSLQTWFNNRNAVPCYLNIDVAKENTNDTGTLYITLNAEQALGSETLRLHAILVEDDVPGAGYWSSSVFEQAFRDNLCGSSGQVITFGSSYPSTINVELPYGTSGMVESNASLAVFVQGQSTREVYNAWYMPVMDIPYNTGTESHENLAISTIEISASPNPTAGSFIISHPGLNGGNNSISLFDISGRKVNSVVPSGDQTLFSVESPGVYLAILHTEGGNTATQRIVVTR